MKALSFIPIGLFLMGCTGTVTGTGNNANGEPVSGAMTFGSQIEDYTPVTLAVIAANGAQCEGLTKRRGSPSMPPAMLSCTDGRSGTATSTLRDYDTALDYRLSDGERGRVSIGGGSSAGAEAIAAGISSFGGTISAKPETQTARGLDLRCTGEPPYVRCRTY